MLLAVRVAPFSHWLQLEGVLEVQLLQLGWQAAQLFVPVRKNFSIHEHEFGAVPARMALL